MLSTVATSIFQTLLFVSCHPHFGDGVRYYHGVTEVLGISERLAASDAARHNFGQGGHSKSELPSSPTDNDSLSILYVLSIDLDSEHTSL